MDDVSYSLECPLHSVIPKNILILQGLCFHDTILEARPEDRFCLWLDVCLLQTVITGVVEPGSEVQQLLVESLLCTEAAVAQAAEALKPTAVLHGGFAVGGRQ